MAEVRIKCPLCGKILSADDKYLRYTVGCGKCHGTFVFDSICIEGNQGTIPVFPLANTDSQATEEIQNNSKRENEKDTSLDGVKVGVIAKAVFTYALQHRKCTEKELRELETSEKSKELFRFKYPLLMSFPKNNIQKESLVISGYCRYYKTPVIIDGIAYFICRQWWDYNRSTILRWAESHRITSDTIKAHIESSPNNTLPRLGSDTTKMPSDGRKRA